MESKGVKHRRTSLREQVVFLQMVSLERQKRIGKRVCSKDLVSEALQSNRLRVNIEMLKQWRWQAFDCAFDEFNVTIHA